jgi:hypothetical protein
MKRERCQVLGVRKKERLEAKGIRQKAKESPVT